MTEVDILEEKLNRERNLAEERYNEEKRNFRKEELLSLERIEFENVFLGELTDYVVPYLQENSNELRLVLGQRDNGDAIIGCLVNRDSSIKFRFNPSIDGHNRIVYNVLNFYRNGEELSEQIIQGMIETRNNVADYFKKAGIIGKPLSKPNFSGILPVCDCFDSQY